MMSFIVEKYFGFDARGHYMCWGEIWDKKVDKSFEDEAIEECQEL